MSMLNVMVFFFFFSKKETSVNKLSIQMRIYRGISTMSESISGPHHLAVFAS